LDENYLSYAASRLEKHSSVKNKFKASTTDF